MNTSSDSPIAFPGTQHLRDEEFALYLDDALDPEELVLVEGHLNSCPDCRLAMTEILDAVTADVANPARLDMNVARIAQMHTGEVTPTLTAYARLTLEEERDGTSPVSVDELRNRFGALVEQWLGSLSSWSVQPAVCGAALAPGSQPMYAGVRSPLGPLFQPVLLEGSLAWAEGPLQVNAIYDTQGSIRSLRASVGGRPDRSGAPIILELSDRHGDSVALQLTPERAFAVVLQPQIQGRLEDLDLKVLMAVLK